MEDSKRTGMFGDPNQDGSTSGTNGTSNMNGNSNIGTNTTQNKEEATFLQRNTEKTKTENKGEIDLEKNISSDSLKKNESFSFEGINVKTEKNTEKEELKEKETTTENKIKTKDENVFSADDLFSNTPNTQKEKEAIKPTTPTPVQNSTVSKPTTPTPVQNSTVSNNNRVNIDSMINSFSTTATTKAIISSTPQAKINNEVNLQNISLNKKITQDKETFSATTTSSTSIPHQNNNTSINNTTKIKKKHNNLTVILSMVGFIALIGTSAFVANTMYPEEGKKIINPILSIFGQEENTSTQENEQKIALNNNKENNIKTNEVEKNHGSAEERTNNSNISTGNVINENNNEKNTEKEEVKENEGEGEGEIENNNPNTSTGNVINENNNEENAVKGEIEVEDNNTNISTGNVINENNNEENEEEIEVENNNPNTSIGNVINENNNEENENQEEKIEQEGIITTNENNIEEKVIKGEEVEKNRVEIENENNNPNTSTGNVINENKIKKEKEENNNDEDKNQEERVEQEEIAELSPYQDIESLIDGENQFQKETINKIESYKKEGERIIQRGMEMEDEIMKKYGNYLVNKSNTLINEIKENGKIETDKVNLYIEQFGRYIKKAQKRSEMINV